MVCECKYLKPLLIIDLPDKFFRTYPAVGKIGVRMQVCETYERNTFSNAFKSAAADTIPLLTIDSTLSGTVLKNSPIPHISKRNGVANIYFLAQIDNAAEAAGILNSHTNSVKH